MKTPLVAWLCLGLASIACLESRQTAPVRGLRDHVQVFASLDDGSLSVDFWPDEDSDCPAIVAGVSVNGQALRIESPGGGRGWMSSDCLPARFRLTEPDLHERSGELDQVVLADATDALTMEAMDLMVVRTYRVELAEEPLLVGDTASLRVAPESLRFDSADPVMLIGADGAWHHSNTWARGNEAVFEVPPDQAPGTYSVILGNHSTGVRAAVPRCDGFVDCGAALAGPAPGELLVDIGS